MPEDESCLEQDLILPLPKTLPISDYCDPGV